MTTLDWLDARKLKAELAADGWLSPDTYCNHFAALDDNPALYLFLLHKPYAEGLLGFERAIVAYVGMSRKVRSRLAAHDAQREIQAADGWVMRWFKPTPAQDLRETKSHYVRRFDPPWNIAGKARGVATQ